MADDPKSECPRHFVCISCLLEVGTFSQPCPWRHSRNIEHVEFLRQTRGPHWRELIEAERGKVH